MKLVVSTHIYTLKTFKDRYYLFWYWTRTEIFRIEFKGLKQNVWPQWDSSNIRFFFFEGGRVGLKITGLGQADNCRPCRTLKHNTKPGDGGQFLTIFSKYLGTENPYRFL